MICPQTKAECKSPVGCGAMGCSILEDNPPHKPTLAEIERLADDHGAAVAMYDRYGTASDRNRMQERRAALMAAITAYGA